jgi:redox-sensitive bicupin YhaK (pirin superfamily)
MIKLFPGKSRFQANHGWLQSNFSFSFSDYYDPDNMNFGALRVLNDDFVEGNRGFGSHPHREMEIVSIVLSGALKHEDSTGHASTTRYGSVQRMSAGTGIIHSEVNPEDDIVNFLQLWFTPQAKGVAPSYEATHYDPAKMRNTLLPIVSHQSGAQVAHIHQDLTIYVSKLEPAREMTFTQPEGRRIFVFVIEGALTLNHQEHLSTRDSARITEVSQLTITATAKEGSEEEPGTHAVDTFFMLIDLP